MADVANTQMSRLILRPPTLRLRRIIGGGHAHSSFSDELE